MLFLWLTLMCPMRAGCYAERRQAQRGREAEEGGVREATAHPCRPLCQPPARRRRSGTEGP